MRSNRLCGRAAGNGSGKHVGRRMRGLRTSKCGRLLGLARGDAPVSSAVTITILITDLVGSTGLSSRVGPAAGETLRREHFELLREEIDNSGGREVKNLGDGLMVAFSSASGAVACAVAMQQRVERRNRNSDEQLAMRIGISMGDATAEEDDYFGAPVVEAARLCDRAAGGQILASDLIARLAGSAGERAFTAIGQWS
jgi:class 3 adenylate cyclase